MQGAVWVPAAKRLPRETWDFTSNPDRCGMKKATAALDPSEAGIGMTCGDSENFGINQCAHWLKQVSPGDLGFHFESPTGLE